MKSTNLKVHAVRNFARMGLDIFVGIERGGKLFQQSYSIMEQEVDPGARCEPSIVFGEDEAQMVFQALWDAGLRPHTGEASAAHVEALHEVIKAKDQHIHHLAVTLDRVLPKKTPDEPSAPGTNSW